MNELHIPEDAARSRSYREFQKLPHPHTHSVGGVEIGQIVADDDGTTKMLVQLHDNLHVEAVCVCSAWVLCWVHPFGFFGGAVVGGGVLDGCGRILALNK